jgi:hypothetical protein
VELYKWSTTAASNDSSVPDGAPNGWLGANVNEWARETMARVRQHASDAAYVDETWQLASVGVKTLVRNSTTQFSVQNCDATAHFTADRRIRIVGATTAHGWVTSSSFSSPHTTVNVTMDGGDVPSSPTQALVHVDSRLRNAAYFKTGAGNLLDADRVDGYQAADIFGPSIHAEALVNGSMTIWQRGTSGSAPAGARTYHADRWWTNPTGAAVTVARGSNAISGSVSPYIKGITGATSVTTCEIAGQRIESILTNYLKTTVTISAFITNATGGALVVDLMLGTPAAADDFTTVTNRLTQSLASITNGSTVRVSHTVDISGYTNLGNGLEIKFRTPSGALDSGTKFVGITEIQIDRSPTFSFFRFRPFNEELARCQRYYQKTFAYGVVPAQNWVGAGTGLPAGAFVIPGSAASTGSDNAGGSWVFSTPMRIAPTITTFNPRAANDQARRIDDADSATITTTATDSMANFAISANADRPYCFGVTASAEL